MKILSLASLMALAAMAFNLTARGDEPATPQAIQLTPQIQAMLAELMKATETDPGESPQPTPAPTSTAPATSGNPAPAPSTAGTRKMVPSSTALHTSSLRTSHLGASTSLTGAARLSNDEWRQLFPQRH